MGKKLDLKKYRRMASSLEIVMKVFTWVAAGVAAVTAIAGIAFMFIPDTSGIFSTLNNDSFGLSPESLISFKVNRTNVGPSDIKTLMIRIMFMASAVSIVFAPIFRQIQLILCSVKDNKPFDINNAKRLTIVGTVLIIGSLVVRAAQYFVASAIVEKLKLDNVSVNIGVDSNMILMGLIVLILAGVFKYGNYLQQQYDSTV